MSKHMSHVLNPLSVIYSSHNLVGLVIHALCQQHRCNLFLKMDISWNQFTQYLRLENGEVGGRGRGGIRAGLEGSCNWELRKNFPSSSPLSRVITLKPGSGAFFIVLLILR